jgi:hypothetical protein
MVYTSSHINNATFLLTSAIGSTYIRVSIPYRGSEQARCDQMQEDSPSPHREGLHGRFVLGRDVGSCPIPIHGKCTTRSACVSERLKWGEAPLMRDLRTAPQGSRHVFPYWGEPAILRQHAPSEAVGKPILTGNDQGENQKRKLRSLLWHLIELAFSSPYSCQCSFQERRRHAAVGCSRSVGRRSLQAYRRQRATSHY